MARQIIPIIRILVTVVLSGVFGYAGAIKIVAPDAFSYDVFNYQILSWEWSVLVAYFLPWLEVIVAVGLWIPLVRTGAALWFAILNALFAAGIASAWVRGLDISCGCFGESAAVGDYPLHIGANLAMGITAFWLAMGRREARQSAAAV